MSDPIIEVEDLGKRYRLGASGRSNGERYSALRDVLTQKVTSLFHRRPSDPQDLTLNSHPPPEDFWALKDVSFSVQRGEVIGIIGRNGAGKSTLLKILSRITEPTEGRIKLRGRVASLLEVGTGFHPELTGRENIFLNGAILGMQRTEIKAKFDEIIAFAEVEKFLDTPVKRYSSGMYVRLAFAVAAHLEPEILIVDEVLAVGDAEFQRKCLGRMQQVARGEKRTVLFVSHNLSAVQTLCSQGIFLEKGELRFHGQIDKVIAEYTKRAIAGSEIEFNPDPTKPSITKLRLNESELEAGNLVLELHYESPFKLSPPVPGIVISSSTGIPIFGSNPRFHPSNIVGQNSQRGIITLIANDLPLQPATYQISVWLGDWHSDYDTKIDILRFDFKFNNAPSMRPNLEYVGHLDWPCRWHHMKGNA